MTVEMSSYKLPKFAKYVPLWKRTVPQYPLYWKGNPQLRVFMPLFWMKMVKPEEKVPHGSVRFEVHPQMTKYDIKNYLEKIYQVPVQSVATEMVRGKERKHPTYGFNIQPEDNFKMATVQLAVGHHFEFPELFKAKKTSAEKSTEDFRKAVNESRREMPKIWDRMDLPPWFR